MKVLDQNGQSETVVERLGISPETTSTTGPVSEEARRMYARTLYRRRSEGVALAEGYTELAEEDLLMAEADLPATIDVLPD